MNVTPVVLEGTIVRLEPLAREKHIAGLLAIGLEPSLWQWTWTRLLSEADLSAYVDTALAEQAVGKTLPFATILRATGAVIGSTRYGNIVPADKRLEIGWTWLGTAYQRSGANREAKLLQLTHAFEVLGCRRVEFKTDALNSKSRNAMEGIGCTFEGVFRKHGSAFGGRVRDTAWYSIIDDDWPKVKATIQGLLLSNR